LSLAPRQSVLPTTPASTAADNASLFRHLFDGRMITAGGYTTEMGVEAVKAGMADAVAFGRMFIANPDLPERIRSIRLTGPLLMVAAHTATRALSHRPFSLVST
jgi:2,4-dienoyl-CoA reductase-like NADH-dependent reductase (Old Yellow Enzyme family)